MHGREGEEEKKRGRHMLDNSFFKDGRKISVGDSALFQAGNSPPFIGIIRCITSGKEDCLKLGVNWLYRPGDIKLGKGILLEAAPNEVFYSFHKDEIPAASLLHPCKVAFLCKGVELPSGISSFVCRRVYDIANKCLWWLTDQDYINERQEEVDQLLDKTQLEMHAAVQSGGRSPKPLNGPTSAHQLKPGSDSVQNSTASFPSHVKGKKRERGDQGPEPIKRERSSKSDDGDSGHFRLESMIKAEIAKITDKGGLINFEGVEKLVNLMQPVRPEKKIDLVGRIMLAGVIAATDKVDYLSRFVQLSGVPILDDWLQEAHKGKIGDVSSPKESDKSIEELLFVLLRALDKLPVNLDALQTCNIGKSVNHLRGHKNLDIQKKARSLVDTWKKRVEAEMKIKEAKSGSSQAVSWPGKPGFPEVPQAGNRRTGSSEVAMKSTITQPSASRTAPIKVGHGDAIAKSTSSSPGSIKSSSALPPSLTTSPKDLHCKMANSSGASDMPLAMIKEEKSSSSSQSQNNSQSCSSDHAKAVGSAWKEDARSSTAGSMTSNKTSSGVSRHRKSSNGFLGSSVTGVQKETALGKSGSLNRNAITSDKASQSGLTYDRALDMPLLDHGNSPRLIVRLPNPGRSPARSVSGGIFEDPSAVGSRASSPGVSEKQDHYDRKVKGKGDTCLANISADVNTESWQSNDVRDGLTGSDEGGRSPAAFPDEEHGRNSDEIGKTMDVPKATTCKSSGNGKGVFLTETKSGKTFEPSLSPIEALIESCAKYSEASASLSVGDDVGMNLLATVAAGEMSKSNLVSPIGSPGRFSPAQEDSFTDRVGKSRLLLDDVLAHGIGQCDERTDGEFEKQGNNVGFLGATDGLQQINTHTMGDYAGDGKNNMPTLEHKSAGEQSEQFPAVSVDLQQTVDSSLKSDGKPDETAVVGCMAVSTGLTFNGTFADVRGEGPSGGANQLLEKGKGNACGENIDGVTNFTPMTRCISSDEKKMVGYVGENFPEGSITASNFVRGSLGDGCDIKNVFSSKKIEEEAVEEPPLCSLLEANSKKIKPAGEGLGTGISTEQQLPPNAANHVDAVDRCDEDAVAHSGSGDVTCPGDADESKTDKADGVEVKSHSAPSENERTQQRGLVPPTLSDLVGGTVVSLGLDHRIINGVEEKSERREVPEHYPSGPASHEELPTIPAQESEHCSKSMASKFSGVGADEMEECASTAEAASSDIASGPDTSAKLDFDLNEGFPVDEGNQGETVISAVPVCSSAVHLPSLSPFPVSPLSTGLHTSITVTSAAKGPFLPPENLLRSKGELGWKGSAATSAFRPAEPRKMLDMQLNTTEITSSDSISGKQTRTRLDIDLNVADDRVLADLVAQRCPESGATSNCDLDRSESSPAIVRSSGGLDLDLNRVDEGTEHGNFSGGSNRRIEGSLLPVRTSTSGGFPNGETNILRDFDLNNGPGFDEVGAEATPRNQHPKSSVAFLPSVPNIRLNTELGNLSSWFPHSNSAVTIPSSFLPDRADQQPFSIVATAGTQRIMGSAPGGTYGGDLYRGPVLSSSPAIAAFPYSGFPFGTNFPLASTSYMDSPSLLGPAGVVSSHYMRPYVVGLSEATTSGGSESSRKWSRQGLDLNAGPGSSDMNGRDERLALASRQLSVANAQASAEEQARMYQAVGGASKRREPEGGWDAERLGYKQTSWQ